MTTFWKWWTAGTISGIGTAVSAVALPQLADRRVEHDRLSTGASSLVTSARTVPNIEQVRQIDFDTADELTFLLFVQHDVLSRRQALRHFTAETIRHRLRAKRWQRPHRGVYVTTTGELTREQLRWIALLAASPMPPDNVLVAGRTALEVLGLKGFTTDVVHLLLADGRRFGRPPIGVVVHRTTCLTAADTRPSHRPPCTAPARSVIDAAQWAVSDREARTVIAMAFQQGKVALDEILARLERMPTAHRRALIAQTAADADGGAHSLAELDFLALSRQAGFPGGLDCRRPGAALPRLAGARTAGRGDRPVARRPACGGLAPIDPILAANWGQDPNLRPRLRQRIPEVAFVKLAFAMASNRFWTSLRSLSDHDALSMRVPMTLAVQRRFPSRTSTV